jgi:threonine dehydrogenase-like Zn-dependent dehydrogenase
MQRLEFREPGRLTLVDRDPTEDAPPGEVVIKPSMVGVCGTDRGIFLGTYPCRSPRVLGHEAIGVISSVGEGVSNVRPGDRVVLDPTQACGQCDRCIRGESSFCRHKSKHEIGVGRDGALAEQLIAPSRAAHRLPPDLPDRRAVLIEPLACVLTAVRRAGLSAEDRVLVLGAGPIGLLSALVARRTAAATEIVETDTYRRGLASRLMGEEPSKLDDMVARRREFSLVIDTAGTLCGRAMTVVADGGRILLVGCDGRAETALKQFDLTDRCLSLIGSCDYHNGAFPGAIDFMTGFECDQIVTHILPLSDFERGFQLLGVGGDGYAAGKVAFVPGS